jgi:hypothetical protein
MQLAHEYKSQSKERTLYHLRINCAHAELKMNMWICRKLLTDSLELQHKVDSLLARSSPECCQTTPACQQHQSSAHAEVNMRVARRLLIESWDLLQKVDASLKRL